MAYSLLTTPESRATHYDEFIVIIEKRAIRNHPVSLRRYIQYMEDNHDSYPTVYPQQAIDAYRHRLEDSRPEVTHHIWESRVTEGFDPFHDRGKGLSTRHPLAVALESMSLPSGVKLSARNWEEISDRYESEFHVILNTETTVSFQSHLAFQEFIEAAKDHGARLKLISSESLRAYFLGVLGLRMDSPMPEKYIAHVRQRLDYMSRQENWVIENGRVAVSHGEQLFTGASRSSSHQMVKWLTVDRKSQHTEDSFWQASYISDQKPWEHYTPNKFAFGMTVEQFLEAMNHQNVYYRIRFDQI